MLKVLLPQDLLCLSLPGSLEGFCLGMETGTNMVAGFSCHSVRDHVTQGISF